MYSLRELSRSDLPEINSWRANRDLIGGLGAPFRYIDLAIDERWYESYLSERANSVRCVVSDGKAADSPLALVTLAAIDWVSRVCELHIMVAPEWQGRGVGTYAVEAMLRHAFLDLGLRRVELSVLADNVRARALYAKVGFKEEGIKRDARYKNGSYHDLHIMALLKEDWRNSFMSDNISGPLAEE